ARVQQLLGGEQVMPVSDRREGTADTSATVRAGAASRTHDGRRPALLWAAGIAVVVGAVALAFWPRRSANPAPAASVPLTEARKLVVQARALVDYGDHSDRQNM